MRRLSGLDAGFLYMETPALHMHTLKLVILDPIPGHSLSFEDTKTEIGRRLSLLPPFRRRLVEVPLRLHHPVWIEDPDFDLDYHVRRVVLPAPGSRKDLDRAIGDIAGLALDRDRPLWRMHVFEGLEDGSVAVLIKIHHAVADGIAASALLVNAMVSAPYEEPPVQPPWNPEPVPTNRQLLIDALADVTRQLFDLPSLVRRTLHNLLMLVRFLRRAPVRAPLPLVHTPRTSFNTAITPHRSFSTTSLPLEDVRRVKTAHGVTVNDVVLAAAAGSVRQYLLERHELPALPLIAGVPVSADPVGQADPSRLEGNRVSNIFTSLATDDPDPLARLARIHDVMAAAKEGQRLLGTDTFAQWVQYTPPRPYAWLVKQYSGHHIADLLRPPMNLVVSNVPGPRTPLFAAGSALREIYSVGPILEGIGLNITVWSYLDRLFVGVLGCLETLPDTDRIARGMELALDELVALTADDAVVGSQR